MKNKSAICIFMSAFLFLAGCSENLVSAKVNEAMQRNDPSLCNTLGEESDRTRCLTTVAQQMRDPRVCLIGTQQEQCVSNAAQNNRQMSYCDVLTDPAQKYTCVAKFTGDTTGRSIETIIADWKTNGRASSCIRQCQNENSRCRTGCINTKNTEIDACGGTHFSDEWGICVNDAGRKERACFSECDSIQYNTCEPPCRET